jgi:hypothetical protein
MGIYRLYIMGDFNTLSENAFLKKENGGFDYHSDFKTAVWLVVLFIGA